MVLKWYGEFQKTEISMNEGDQGMGIGILLIVMNTITEGCLMNKICLLSLGFPPKMLKINSIFKYLVHNPKLINP